ncbi:hypothetical protein HDU67_007950 [Dinochytrium kinnereticum]|nr:hypothetical protein HDU67_007950 [Dinochytrium kinnereticum]
MTISNHLHTIPLPSLFSKPLPPFSTSPTPIIDQDTPDLQLPAIHCLLLRDVGNAEEVKKRIVAGDEAIPECVMVNGKGILSLDQLVVAATRAFLLQHQNALRTKTLFSEILFNLSPNSSISEAMKWFGIGKGVKDVVVLFTGNVKPSDEVLNRLLTIIDGRLAPTSELDDVTDVEMLKKIFKITTESGIASTASTEGLKDWMLSVVISSMALKGYN